MTDKTILTVLGEVWFALWNIRLTNISANDIKRQQLKMYSVFNQPKYTIVACLIDPEEWNTIWKDSTKG